MYRTQREKFLELVTSALDMAPPECHYIAAALHGALEQAIQNPPERKAAVADLASKLVSRLRSEDRWMTRAELLVGIVGKANDKSDALAFLREHNRVGHRLVSTGGAPAHEYHWNRRQD
jgi:hypothetical protein